ncbi:ribosome-associated ATPase/putative transporter RbbA [Paraburkholderia caballeronis]|uniref:Ribosome-dependent ATPase n=1 Tax=Paraburkholderia caballeronis TaxID=416943 RepID=A0A1H7P8F1_9BURK|nr:ribosome-associated ATPase/putative transporter RbbA [Paraburkholderia caballeronis]PXW25341.1 ribosome-dependent ATPase [Paraburkholderia caballeronis]PXX00948.1 ribosome-dependent ATPase [Paraburkholderia caballeronis]RAJ99699.1 ribosome-dependent ATPase [Paraburkholderia caballeronis]SEE41230.1 ribosome-dependent ATPase [Paraburkholderia caballeronis]SEL31916.1 ribosome-dependent ATPase [Paraburkholderia caballeronis]
MTDDDAIRVTDVTHRYGSILALDAVSLTLPSRTTIGLIGPDGVGKSTLLGLLAGVKRIQHGELSVLGANLRVRAEREARLPRIAFMPQGLGRNLYPTLSVYENVDFFGRLFGFDANARAMRIRRLLDATGLAPFPDRPAGKLSGGMKQKLGLCCALVRDPDLLILDEPTTGVDPLSRRQFWTLVDALRAERAGMTVIVATAYMDEAQRFEHLVAMDGGRVLVNDRTAAVLARAGTHDLEQAYVSLLPPARRGSTEPLVIPPYTRDDGPAAIEAEGLTRRFGDFVAVDHVSFRIGRGEIFGFLGSNGCGKTTTMKMLTGLLDATSGAATLLGKPVDAADMNTRMKVGYMSQSFSLYEELTVRQNLDLHARLFRLEGEAAHAAVERSLTGFELEPYAHEQPASLSLGIRQRLQLAAACLHGPEVLILDEPTSGVDPGARDMFWRHLIHLSRDGRVTIFISTHFMNEAARCDRISFMHRGRVLAVGSPDELRAQQHADTLEDAFVACLEAVLETNAPANAPPGSEPPPAATTTPGAASTGALSRIWAFALRESVELARDRLRLAFALLGPVVLLFAASLSVSFDVENVRFAALDRDRTLASRDVIEQFAGSRYFVPTRDALGDNDARHRLQASQVQLVVEIPPDFGRDLLAGRRPELSFYIDGSSPFPGATISTYVNAVLLDYAQKQMRADGVAPAALPMSIETRFVYNEQFRSIYAITPGTIMLALILIPTMLTALGVVREKEMGSITNLYASPARVGEYLIGKQLPYVVLAMVSYLLLVALAITVLGVPLKGSFAALSIGALLFVFAATGLGLLISTFVRSQVAAIFGTAILCLIPSVNFSGLLYPVSTLTGSSYWVGLGFPSSWFQLVSLGSFTKGLGAASFGAMYAALAGFALVYLAGACCLLPKQEA